LNINDILTVKLSAASHRVLKTRAMIIE